MQDIPNENFVKFIPDALVFLTKNFWLNAIPFMVEFLGHVFLFQNAIYPQLQKQIHSLPGKSHSYLILYAMTAPKSI